MRPSWDVVIFGKPTSEGKTSKFSPHSFMFVLHQGNPLASNLWQKKCDDKINNFVMYAMDML